MPKERKPLGRGKSLSEALEKVQKDRGLLVSSLDEAGLEVEAISTGNIAIDYITGVGGLPVGRLIELYGAPSSGKTTTALQAAARIQQEGGTVLFLDYESSMDPEYCKALGLDTKADSFLYASPETFEQGMNTARELIETGEISLVIVDSVAAMTIEKELSIETGGSTFADKAKLMAQAMRQLTTILSSTDTTMVFLNHVQDVIDASPMGQKLAASGVKRTTTPGGVALKFHASLRIEFKQTGNLRTPQRNELTDEMEDVVTQTKVKVTVVKNKVAPPFKSAELRVRFGRGFSQAYSVFQILVGHNAIKKGTGGVYTFPAELARAGEDGTMRGEENILTELEEDPEWLEKLTTYAQNLLNPTQD